MLAGLLTLILERGEVVDILVHNDIKVIALVVLRHISDLERLGHDGQIKRAMRR